MATQEHERRSPPLEPARTASDEPQLPGLGSITGGSAATTMAIGGGGGGEEERGPEGGPNPDNVRSSSPWVALMSAVSSHIASPQFQRKPRSLVRLRPRAAPSHPWGFKIPDLPPAPAKKKRKRPAKKRDRPCPLCGTTETPLWRTWPTDRRVMLCNACGIRVRAPGTVLPELVYLLPPATATTTVVSELEQPVPPPQEIQQPVSDSPGAVLPEQVHVHLPPPATATTTVVSELQQPPQKEIQDWESPPDSPILESMVDFDVYLLKRTSPRRDKSPPPPPPTAEPAPPAAPPAPGKPKKKCCQHCATTKTPQWRTGPAGEGTLCNSCGVRHRKGHLVPEYRPWASPSFNESEHSNKHREVLRIRKRKDHPAPPAPFKPLRTRKRRKGKGQQQPAQIRKKRKDNEEQDQPAEPAAVAMMLQVRKKNKGKTQRLPPEPALLKRRRELKGKEPRAGDGMGHHHLLPPPPPPALLLPHAGDDDMVLQHLPSPPLPLPHAGDDMEMEQHLLLLLLPPPPPLELPQAAADNDMEQAHAGDELMMSEPIPPPAYGRENLFRKGKAPAQVRKKRKGNKEQNQPAAHVQPAAAMAVLQVREKNKGKAQRLPPPEPALLKRRNKEPKGKEQHRRPPQPAATQPRAGNDMLQNLPPPLALPHAGGELMMDEPIPPLDPFLFDGPAAPRLIDDEPVIVIVIDDD